jgi:DNA-binding transcriptional regulator of glucitol operon
MHVNYYQSTTQSIPDCQMMIKRKRFFHFKKMAELAGSEDPKPLIQEGISD